MGLPNPGIYKWIENNNNFNDVVSIYPGNNDYTLRLMLKELNKTNIRGIELNMSCPNVLCKDYIFDFEGYETERILKETKANTDIPILLKLSVTSRIESLFPNIEKYVEAISINSVPWNFLYPNIVSPFESLGGGGLSGKIVQHHTWTFIKKLVDITNIPIIGCSIWEYEDIEKLYDIGCRAISFGSIFLRYPWRPTQFVRKYMENQNI